MKKENQKLYECKECGLKYKEKELAKKCTKWCRKHHTCNIEIIKHAVEE
ncbi:MAG: hypothetical protein R3346_02080 [Candidatus Spechtbacterales bacterium]|nr:hypothetical protein [Candidatus Spechtbacterales bacterium]